MRLSGILALAICVSFSVFADMAPEDRCEKQGDVAEQASNLRISGVDKETAIESLNKIYDHPDTGVTANNIRGLVTVSYMAKMTPENMRKYVIDQCKKDILK